MVINVQKKREANINVQWWQLMFKNTFPNH